MQISRKIYYELATGNVLQNTGEHVGDTLIETTVEQDFAMYLSLIDRVPSSIGCLHLEYGAYRNEFGNSNGCKVNLETGLLEFSYKNDVEPIVMATVEERLAILEQLELERMLGGA
jgi:hypothetical protein